MMTREEAIEIFEQKGWWIAQKETLTSKQAEEIIKLNDAVDLALSALRPVSREQVEKVWRGEWKRRNTQNGIEWFVRSVAMYQLRYINARILYPSPKIGPCYFVMLAALP